MQYYIYVHRRKDNNKVFYIERGCGRRAYARHNFKTRLWSSVEKISGHYVEFLHENLTLKEAKELETGYLLSPPDNWELVNRTVHKEVDYNYEVLSELFYYNSESPSGLSWKIKPKTFGKFSIKIGDKVGSKSWTSLGNPKSWDTTVSGIKYKVHRIVWVLLNGSIPGDLLVDHIDGNPFNNKIENLRLVTFKENSLNKKNSKIQQRS